MKDLAMQHQTLCFMVDVLHFKDSFLFTLLSFFFLATHIALSDSIELRKCESINVYEYKAAAQFLTVVNNQEQLSQLEELVQFWCKQIEQVSIKIILRNCNVIKINT